MNSNASFGMPRSLSTARTMRLTGESAPMPYRIGAGMKPNMRALMRIVICGACAARAKMFRTSPMRCGSGSVRWKHLPSSPFLCAR